MVARVSHTDRNGDPFSFLPFQQRFIQKFKKNNIVLCLVSRQEGKTEVNCRLVKDFMFKYSKNKNPNVLITMQSYDSVKDVYFNRLKELLKEVPESLIQFRSGSEQSGRCEIIMNRPWFKDRVIITLGSAYSERVADSFRGKSVDLLILDELGFYPASVWAGIFRPMIARVRGKAILTSTPNGPNHLLALCEQYARYEEEGIPGYGLIFQDVYHSQTFTQDEVTLLKREFLDSGYEDIWAREYELDFFAALGGEYPFGELLSKNKNVIVNMPPFDPKLHTIHIITDIGGFGNHPALGWIKSPATEKPTIIYYDDRYEGMEHFLQTIYTEFKTYKCIHIVFPHDISHKEYVTGSRLRAARQFIHKWGLTQKIRISVGAKPKDKKEHWRITFENIRNVDFVTSKCGRGFEKLRKFRFSKDAKTRSINFGNIVNNGSQHVADAYLYLIAEMKKCLDISKDDGYTNRQAGLLSDSDSYKDMNYLRNPGPASVNYITTKKLGR